MCSGLSFCSFRYWNDFIWTVAKKPRNRWMRLLKIFIRTHYLYARIFKHVIKDYKIDDMKISSFMISVPDGSEIGKQSLNAEIIFTWFHLIICWKRLLRGTRLWYKLTFCWRWRRSRTCTGHVSCNINRWVELELRNWTICVKVRLSTFYSKWLMLLSGK